MQPSSLPQGSLGTCFLAAASLMQPLCSQHAPSHWQQCCPRPKATICTILFMTLKPPIHVASPVHNPHAHHLSLPSSHLSWPSHHPSLPLHHPSLPSHHPSLPLHHPSLPLHHPSLPSHHPSLPSHHPSTALTPPIYSPPTTCGPSLPSRHLQSLSTAFH